MHLFIKFQFFIIFGLSLGLDFEIFSRFQEMRWWITALVSYYLAKKRKTVLGGFSDPMHFFIIYSIFYNFWPNFGPRFWDIFSISGNALMSHFFSIVISCEKAQNGSVRFCGSDATFQLISMFYNFLTKFGHRFWDIFSVQEMRWWVTSLAS